MQTAVCTSARYVNKAVGNSVYENDLPWFYIFHPVVLLIQTIQ
jgi:hypothetical protein